MIRDVGDELKVVAHEVGGHVRQKARDRDERDADECDEMPNHPSIVAPGAAWVVMDF